MTVTEYLAAKGMSINALSAATKISYTTLRPHVREGKPLSVRTAQRLEAFSHGEMNASEILGLAPPPAPAAPAAAPRKTTRPRPASHA